MTLLLLAAAWLAASLALGAAWAAAHRVRIWGCCQECDWRERFDSMREAQAAVRAHHTAWHQTAPSGLDPL